MMMIKLGKQSQENELEDFFYTNSYFLVGV